MTEYLSRTIAYLAPEIPALSATFVYEEMLGLERRGLAVVPFSVHRPLQAAAGHQELADRTVYLYDGPKLLLALAGFRRLFRLPGWRRGLGWLLQDMRECGLVRAAAWKLVFQFLSGARLANHLVGQGCVHLHIHFAHVPTQIGMYAAAMAGIPFTVMAHANDIFERGLLLSRKAERARKFLTISEYNRAYLERIGVAPEHLAVVRCGVSFPAREAVPSRESRLSWRIGTLGRLVEKKGVDVLIRAVGLLRDRGHGVELAIAGDGPLRVELEALAASLGLGDSVHFEGNLSHAQVRGWMHELDIFVLACKPDANGDMDGIPVVLMEAMSQQVPVVSTRLSGIPELVIDGETGLLANPGDAAGLATQIGRLLAAPGLGQSLALLGAAHVRAEFGQEVNLDRLLGHMGIATRQ
jgi:glycosyltransferase involved in cell wall biosynthesis